MLRKNAKVLPGNMRFFTFSLVGITFSVIAAYGQGQFVFNNHVVPDVDARFVVATDPPGNSSVGTNFQVQLFAGPIGTPLDQLPPTEPASVSFRGPAGTAVAGYVYNSTITVPNNPPLGQVPNTEVLVRAFDGPSWQTANYHFQGVYTVEVIPNGGPPILQLGTSPLVLESVPEPAILTLSFAGLGLAALVLRRWPACTRKAPSA
jgi:hypothetical protein